MEHFVGRATRHAFVRSPVKGTPYISVTFRVVEGSTRGSEYEWQGYFTPATLKRTVQSLRMCGARLEGGDLEDMTGLGSRDVDIQIEETDRGARVAWVNEPRPKLSDAERKKLASELSGAVVDALAEPIDDPFPG